MQTQPLRLLCRIFSLSISSLGRGGAFCSYFNARDTLGSNSHKFKPHIITGVTAGGEFCWVIPHFPLLILKFSKEKCTQYLQQLQLCLEKLPNWGFCKVIVTDQKLRKTWKRNHKNHNVKKAAEQREKRKKKPRFQDV